ncbi:PAB-dependent poly(A)-specific ribonuclease subunit 3 isoform 1 [Galdieria sulphuraria]|uniref:PAB-dependent poly(A)-specific ribonuclease subunit 3 isoform 1 n=1 Tax=Galdieria sulphuraria TaxID=130081 RepID=M2XPJ2_GALSU|nr:PAB-dependent poly(A)-specific ribonuclease subunit 3 isoform 1 [Galdieria sulphuraria]EME32132.1 PAB-dependent poly(A)-specific ribonuclease subunit 3 isoform 1 [Galdieria sulphuraria]|eukprot:XP_005708652.1 PAB-dependent poly(A)-specific ribonuclease subunit 3 isoform 1 [Galdieria sulphuraria]
MEDVSRGGRGLRASAPEFTFQDVRKHSDSFHGYSASSSDISISTAEDDVTLSDDVPSFRNLNYLVNSKAGNLAGSSLIETTRKQSLGSPSRQPRKNIVFQENLSEKSCMTEDLFEESRLVRSSKKKVDWIFCSHQITSSLPTTINQYHSLYQIEETSSGVPVFLNYRCLSSSDGKVYLLRRVLGAVPFDSQFVLKCVERWKKIRHPSVVPLCEVFSTFAFTQGAANELVFVYPFYDNAQIFRKVYLPSEDEENKQVFPLPEKVIWTILIQLISSLDALHSAEMVAGESLSSSGILVVGTHRIRLNKCGIAESLSTDSVGSKNYSQYSTSFVLDIERKKQDDVWRLMHLLFLLTLRSHASIVKNGVLQIGVNDALNVLQSMAFYSHDILHILSFLVDHYNRTLPVSITQICSIVAPQIIYDYGHVWLHADTLEAELDRRLNSSRLFQLISLFGFVLDWDDSSTISQWSETEDKFVLRLFYDYMFHPYDNEVRRFFLHSHGFIFF